ncbi:hypothetical protein TNCV_1565801 [Trichonephila clavipes]|nr:hypothetical protein TNCV_1565801 [Trichonephila clavipes]
MFDPSSFVNPTPLADADTSRDVLPRGGTSQVGDSDQFEPSLMYLWERTIPKASSLLKYRPPLLKANGYFKSK